MGSNVFLKYKEKILKQLSKYVGEREDKKLILKPIVSKNSDFVTKVVVDGSIYDEVIVFDLTFGKFGFLRIVVKRSIEEMILGRLYQKKIIRQSNKSISSLSPGDKLEKVLKFISNLYSQKSELFKNNSVFNQVFNNLDWDFEDVGGVYFKKKMVK